MSIHWQWVHDAQVMHYAVFLIEHGFRPYVQIIDINLPGSYLFEWVGLCLFGKGDLAWRVYDLSLLAFALIGCVVIAGKDRRAAGLLAGMSFALVHIADGAWYLGERDLVIATLLILAFAAAFIADRRNEPMWLFGSAMCFALSLSIKPLYLPVALVVLLATILRLRRKQNGMILGLTLTITGFTVVAAVFAGFLLYNQALTAFVHSFFKISVLYRRIGPPPFLWMLVKSIPLPVAPLLGGAVALAWTQRLLWSFEDRVLLLGTLLCYVGYFIQNKGFVYHRYPYLLLGMLFALIQANKALTLTRLPRLLAFGVVAFATLATAPYLTYLVYKQRHFSSGEGGDPVTSAMMSAIQSAGVGLDGDVECLDTDAGCYGALFRLGIVQRTGDLGDHLLFWPESNKTILEQRRRFMRAMEDRPPRVIVLSNKWFPFGQTYDMIKSWPEFRSWLAKHYAISNQADFPGWPGDPSPLSFRVYRIKAVPGK